MNSPSLPKRNLLRLQVAALAICLLLAAFPQAFGSGPMPSGGGGGGGGGGFGIGVNIGGPPIGPGGGGWTYLGTTSQAEIDRANTQIIPEGGSAGGRKAVPQAISKPKAPQRVAKLSKPRIGYLEDLAMEIDPGVRKAAFSNPAETLANYERVLAQARKTGDKRAEQAALANLGALYFLIGWFSRSANMFQQLLNYAAMVSDTRQQGIAQSRLIAVMIAWGDYAKAVEYSQQPPLSNFRRKTVGGPQFLLNNLGVLEKNKGSFESARANFNEAIQANPKNNKLLVVIFSNMANLYRQWGFQKEASEYYQKAIDAAKQLGDPAKETEILLASGQGYLEMGNYQKGLEALMAAIRKSSQNGLPTDWASKLAGDAYLDAGRLQEAESLVRQADYDSSLGRLYLLKSDPGSAKKYYEQLLRAAQNAGNSDDIFTAHVGLGKVYEFTGSLDQARGNYSKAIEIIEQSRLSLLPSERRNFYSGRINGFSRSEPAKGLVRIALMQKNGAQSIYPSELLRARDFAENLARKFDFDAFGVPQEVLEKEVDFENKLASLKAGLSALPKQLEPRRYNDILNQVKKAESDAKNLTKEIAATYKSYALARYPKPVQLENALIGPEEHVILFDVLADGVGARLIKGKKVVKTAYNKLPGSDLEREIQEFRKPFETAKLDEFDPRKAARLYQILLADLMKDVPDGVPITIIPDGLLALIPFEALVTGGAPKWQEGKGGKYPTGLKYFGDRHPITYYPSITALTLTRSLASKGVQGDRRFVMADPVFTMADARAQSASSTLMAAAKSGTDSLRLMAAIEDETDGFFRLPRLAETEGLARHCSEQLYGRNCEAYTGLESSKSNFMANVVPHLASYKSMVFATHGLAASDIPGIMEPALALSMVPPGTDGFLTMSEIAGLKMSPEVAALVACQTGVGLKLPGEGVMSMGRAFLSAGAKSVVMSLWSVSEEASVNMMDSFFRNLHEGKSKLEAWTEARNSVRQAGFEHPFFWAAFVLVGESK